MAIVEYTAYGAGDFRQRYKNTYGWFCTPAGKDVLVYVSDVGERKLTFNGADGEEYFLYPDKGEKFKFIPIEKKVFQHDGSIVVAQRVPARQYKRGISEENSSFRSLYGGAKGVDFAIVKSYATHVPSGNFYLGVNIYVNHVITNQFAMVDRALYIYDTLVAVVEGDTFVVKEPLFLQEIKDLVTKLNLPQKVL